MCRHHRPAGEIARNPLPIIPEQVHDLTTPEPSRPAEQQTTFAADGSGHRFGHGFIERIPHEYLGRIAKLVRDAELGLDNLKMKGPCNRDLCYLVSPTIRNMSLSCKALHEAAAPYLLEGLVIDVTMRSVERLENVARHRVYPEAVRGIRIIPQEYSSVTLFAPGQSGADSDRVFQDFLAVVLASIAAATHEIGLLQQALVGLKSSLKTSMPNYATAKYTVDHVLTKLKRMSEHINAERMVANKISTRDLDYPGQQVSRLTPIPTPLLTRLPTMGPASAMGPLPVRGFTNIVPPVPVIPPPDIRRPPNRGPSQIYTHNVNHFGGQPSRQSLAASSQLKRDLSRLDNRFERRATKLKRRKQKDQGADSQDDLTAPGLRWSELIFRAWKELQARGQGQKELLGSEGEFSRRLAAAVKSMPNAKDVIIADSEYLSLQEWLDLGVCQAVAYFMETPWMTWMGDVRLVDRIILRALVTPPRPLRTNLLTPPSTPLPQATQAQGWEGPQGWPGTGQTHDTHDQEFALGKDMVRELARELPASLEGEEHGRVMIGVHGKGRYSRLSDPEWVSRFMGESVGEDARGSRRQALEFRLPRQWHLPSLTSGFGPVCVMPRGVGTGFEASTLGQPD